jgi:hypothetical protein
MFQPLLAHRQEALHKWHLVYCMRVMSVGCIRVKVELTYHAHNIASAACETPPEDDQVMLKTCRGPLILNKLNKKCIMLVSLY